MATKKTKSIGERGFLSHLLPLLQKKAGSAFLVPPGDDAAVLKSSSRPVLTIDGLTEGTHFLWSWKDRCEKKFNLSFGRALGWKLMGSTLSDLAAMGATRHRWAMVYLGASNLDMKFLMELYKGVRETAEQYDCVLAGGDTVRAHDLSLVAAAGADLASQKPLTRTGAWLGDWVCVAGTVGDAGAGLGCLKSDKSIFQKDAGYFVKRFFQARPLFREGELLSKTRGVSSLMDLSDALPECLELLIEASHCGADIHIDSTPVSKLYLKVAPAERAFVHSGEDYALLFTASAEAIKKLKTQMSFTVIGHITPKKQGLRLLKNGQPTSVPASFEHF